ncbi:FecR family protein [Echinicola sediminis]
MSKSKYTIEDFVLDTEFKKWVLKPDNYTNSLWRDFLEKYPNKSEDIKAARVIVLNMAFRSKAVSEERLEQTWENIDRQVGSIKTVEGKVVPINQESVLKRTKQNKHFYEHIGFLYRVAAVLMLSLLIAFIAARLTMHEEKALPIVVQKEVKEYVAPLGVKSNLILSDGSRVILNSNSSIRFIEGFEDDKRVIELKGEAFFDVAEDKTRPFIVNAANTSTKALGTSFNISAYKNEDTRISLVTGVVEVEVEEENIPGLRLIPGEAVSVGQAENPVKYLFKEAEVLSWTRKTIFFEDTPIKEVVRVLENWYGVHVELANEPSENFGLSGVFKNKSLEDVLEGMQYSARIDYEIKDKDVTITFKQ